MSYLRIFKCVKISWIKVFLVVILFVFCGNLFSQKQIGLCIPVPASGLASIQDNVGFTINNPIPGASEYTWNAGVSSPSTAINSGGTVSVDHKNQITITNSYRLVSTNGIFTENTVTYTLVSKSGTPGTTTIKVQLIPQPLIRPIPPSTFVDVCSNKIFNLPLSIDNHISSTYGYTWTATPPALNQDIPVTSNRGTQLLVGNGIVEYTISATIDTVRSGSHYKGLFFPNFNSCKTTSHNKYNIRLNTAPQKPKISTKTMTICISSAKDLISLGMSANNSLKIGWYQLSGKTKLSFTHATGANTQVSGFEGADKSKGPLAEEYIIIAYETNVSCDTLKDTISILVWKKPIAKITTSNPIYFCNGDNTISTITLNASSPNALGIWTGQGKPPLPTMIGNVSDSTIKLTNSLLPSTVASETYTYIWEVENAHCNASLPKISDTISVIVVHSSSTANVVSSSTKACADNNTVDLYAYKPTFGKGSWSFFKTLIGTGTPTFSYKPGTDTAIIVTLPPVTKDSNVYIFKWTLQSGTCSDSSIAYDTVYVYAKDEANITSPDTVWRCSNALSNVTLEATPLKTAKGVWNLISKPSTAPNPIIKNTTNPSLSVSGLVAPNKNKPDTNMYVFTWSISGTNINVCSITKTTDTVRIAVVNPPSLAEIKDGTPDTMYSCSTTSATISIKATPPTIGQGTWTWTSLVPGKGNITINTPHDPILNATAEVPTSVDSLVGIGYKLTWTVNNGTSCTPNTKSIIVYTFNSASASNKRVIQQECATKNPQIVYLQTAIPNPVIWHQLPPPNSDVLLSGFPNTNRVFTISIVPPQGSAVGHYMFTVGSSSSKCSSKDTIELLINNPATAPSFTPGSKYGDTNYVCHVSGTPDTLYGLSMRNDPNTTVGKGGWSQTNDNGLVPVHWFNVLTNKPDTLGSINLVFTDQNTISGGTGLATYTLKWMVKSGACDSPYKNVVFVVAKDLVSGVAEIKNKGTDGIRWLCGNGATRDTILNVAGGYKGKGVWTQLLTPPYLNTAITPEQDPSDSNLFRLKGLPFVSNKPDTIKLAYIWNITLDGSKCIQTSSDTIKIYIVSTPPDIIPPISNFYFCGNSGSKISTIIDAPTPAFGQGQWSAVSPDIVVTPQSNITAIVDSLPSPSTSIVRWNLKNAGCAIEKIQDVNIVVSNGAKAQVKDRTVYVCNDGYNLTINNNKIIKADVKLKVEATAINSGTGKWTVAPSFDGILTIPPGTESNVIISPTLTIQGNNLAKDSTIFKLYWNTNSTECGITIDSTIIIAYAPLSDSITNGYNSCLVEASNQNLSTTLFGPYIDGKSGKWEQDTLKQIIGNIKLNYNTAIINKESAIQPDFVRISNLIVPKDDSVNAYAIKRIVPATYACPERSKTDTIRVYQKSSNANVLNKDTIYLCTSGTLDIDTFLIAKKPAIGQGFWKLISQSKPSSIGFSKVDDTTAKITIHANDSCIYRFRWHTFISTFCKDTVIGSNKDIYIVTTKALPYKAAEITHIRSTIKQDTNWICQTTSTELTNKTYTEGKGSWRVISGQNPLSVRFVPVTSAPNTTVNVLGLSLPSSSKNDTSKYLIEFSIVNSICDTSRDTIKIFILRNASIARLAPMPGNPGYFCSTVPIVLNPPDDSTVIQPLIGTGMWTKKDSLPGTGVNYGTDTIKWTWTVSNRCFTSSVQRTYIIANNPQGDAIIRNKPFPNQDTLVICLAMNKDTTLRFNGNKPLSGGSGRWSYFLNGPLIFTSVNNVRPPINDSSVNVNGFSGNDSTRVYGLVWNVFKANFCPPTYDTAYVKVFRRPEKPLFKPDTSLCIPPNLIKNRDSLVFNISPSNISSYTFGKFQWSIARGDSSATTPTGSAYIYILPPTESQKTARIILKNTTALTDSFSYIVRLKVSGGGTCIPDSNDYKITIYPAITNKESFGYIDASLTDPGSKIIRVCETNPYNTRVYLANKTVKPYQEGSWQILARPNGQAVFYPNIYPTHKSNITSIYRMSIPTGQTMAQYTTMFTITNKNINNPTCNLRDTVTIYLITPGATVTAGVLEKTDSFCYGTTGQKIELTNPVGAIRLDWERKPVSSATFTTFIPNTLNLTYNLPEIINEYDYRVKVSFVLPGGSPPVDIGTCPTSITSPAWSNEIRISLKNKDTYRLGKITPKQQEVCAESPISLKTTYNSLPSELNGHTINKWQTYQTNAYGTGAILPGNNPWVDQNVSNFEYKQTAPKTAQTIFYRAWINDVDVNGCPFVTDTAIIYIKPKPKMSGNPYPICAENNFIFRFDSTTEGGYGNKISYPNPFTTSIQKITWKLANTTSNSRTGMVIENGVLSGFRQPIIYNGINNDTLPLIDTVIAYATGTMGCESDLKTITFKVYPKPRAELTNSYPLVNCPPIYVDSFIKLREYKTLNSGYYWNVRDYTNPTNTWTSNGTLPPHIQTNYAQNFAIQLIASSKYNDSITGRPCPSNILIDTLFSFGKITPNIQISDSICYGNPITFTNNSSVNTMTLLNDTLMYKWWDKKDSLISTDIIPSTPFIPRNIYAYKDSFYTIKYEISNRCYSLFDTKDIHIQSIPKANLMVNMDSFCSGTTINIWKDNELGNNPNLYKNEWVFGDGSAFSTIDYPFVANINNPIKHRYDSIRYAVDTLLQIISNNCGSDTQTHLIKILPIPKPAINLTTKDTICGSLNKYAILNKTFFGGKEPVSTNWYINGNLVQKRDSIYSTRDTLLYDTLWHSFAEYVDKNYPDEVKPISVKLLVTPTLGCAADSIDYILVGSTAQPEIFIDTIQPCPPASFNIKVTSAAGINTWDWYQNNAPINANTSFIPSIQFGSGDYRIKVVVSSLKQVCPIDSAFKTIVVYGYPQSQFELKNPMPYCYTPFPAHYQSTAIDANAKMMPITDWYWRIDSISTSINYPKNIEQKDFIYTYPLGGEYTTKHWVQDTRGRFHCLSDTITRNYRILGRSTSNFTMIDTTCATYTISLNNNSDAFLGFGSTLIDSSYWIMGDGTEMKKLSGGKNINYSYKTGGKYNISLLTKGNNGVCIFDTLTKTIVVRGFPKANFDVISPCSGNYSTFNNLSSAGFADRILGYNWIFEDGQISNVKNPSKLYDIPGTYRAKLTVNGLLCPLKSDTTISFVISPAAKPIIFPTIYVGENIPFDLIAPSDNNSYVWLDNNKLSVNGNEPNAQIVTSSLPGLIADTFYLRSTSGDCIVDNIQVVQALPKLEVVAPSGFTPNNDGVNDLFIPKYVGIKKLNYFQIFDRFGQLLFSTSDKNQYWDGTFSGKPLPTATYIWVVSGTNDKGEQVNASGGITLIREKE